MTYEPICASCGYMQGRFCHKKGFEVDPTLQPSWIFCRDFTHGIQYGKERPVTTEQLNELEATLSCVEVREWDIRCDNAVVDSKGYVIVDDATATYDNLVFISAANPATVKALIGAVKMLAHDAAVLGFQQLRDPKSTPEDAPLALKRIASNLIQQALQEAGE